MMTEPTTFTRQAEMNTATAAIPPKTCGMEVRGLLPIKGRRVHRPQFRIYQVCLLGARDNEI